MSVSIKKDRKKGRGVYTNRPFKKGELVEECELLLLPLAHVPLEIEGHVFEFTRRTAAIALGNGSLYNHSDHPNCYFYFNYRKQKLLFRTLRTIRRGEELTVEYGYDEELKARFGLK